MTLLSHVHLLTYMRTVFCSSSEESSGEEEEEEEAKPKGVEGLIEIENPNRAIPKAKKVATVTEKDQPAQLSRREREELEKQRNKAHYEKMHAAGLTEQVCCPDSYSRERN